jgi:hypothetical protein
VGGQAFIVAVVPFFDCFGDFDGRVGVACGGWGVCLVVPGVALAAAEVEEFEGALGAGAGGDVATSHRY